MRSARKSAEPGTVLFLSLVAITLVGPMSIHLFLPATALIQRAFSVSADLAQLAFSLSMFATALGTLIYGSLSDRLGRLPVLIGGLVLFTAGAAIAALAPSITLLVAGRILQGLGAACGVVIARAIVRDVYGADRLGQMIAYLTTVYVIGPMVAPPIGGALGDAFGWQSILIVPAAMGGVVIALAVLAIGETRPPGMARPTGLLGGYGRLLGSARFDLFTLHVGLGGAAFFALNAGASFLVIDALGRPATEFGLYFMLGPVGFMSGNFLAGRLNQRFGARALMAFGAWFALFGLLTIVPLHLALGLHPMTLFVPCGLMSLGQGLSMPHAQAAAIATDASLTGTASGLVVFSMFMLGAVFSQIAAALYDGTAVPLMVVVIATMVAASASVLAALRLKAPAQA